MSIKNLKLILFNGATKNTVSTDLDEDKNGVKMNFHNELELNQTCFLIEPYPQTESESRKQDVWVKHYTYIAKYFRFKGPVWMEQLISNRAHGAIYHIYCHTPSRTF